MTKQKTFLDFVNETDEINSEIERTLCLFQFLLTATDEIIDEKLKYDRLESNLLAYQSAYYIEAINELLVVVKGKLEQCSNSLGSLSDDLNKEVKGVR